MPSNHRTDPGSGSGPPRYPGTFLLAFREAAADLCWEVKRWLGDMVECVDEEGRKHVIGLENLYRRARLTERQNWVDLIREFLKTAAVAEESPALPAELAAVAGQLMIRVGTPMQSLTGDAKVWSEALGETGLCVNLVIDYDNRMCYVSEKLVKDSNKAGQEWLRQAAENLRTRTPLDCLQKVDADTEMRLCAVGDSYDSSRALLLNLLLPEHKTDGFFVAVPGRDQLLVLPVCRESLNFVHLLKVLAEKNYRTTPYPISREVYWICDGVWRLFRIEISAKEATIEPPKEFLDVLARIAPENIPAPEDSEDDGGGEESPKD